MIVPSTPVPAQFSDDEENEDDIFDYSSCNNNNRGRGAEVPNFAFDFGHDGDDDDVLVAPANNSLLNCSGLENAQCLDRRKSDIDPARSMTPVLAAERTRSASVNFIMPTIGNSKNNGRQQAVASAGQNRSNLSLPAQKHPSAGSNHSISDVSSTNLSPFLTPFNQSPAIPGTDKSQFDFDTGLEDSHDCFDTENERYNNFFFYLTCRITIDV